MPSRPGKAIQSNVKVMMMSTRARTFINTKDKHAMHDHNLKELEKFTILA